jgi:hypothetical protein
MGWARTGNAFKVYTDPASNANPVCRFYIPPVVGDSHFYTASPVECADQSSDSDIHSRIRRHIVLPMPYRAPMNIVPVYRV